MKFDINKTEIDVEDGGLSYRGYTVVSLISAGVGKTAVLTAVRSLLCREIDVEAERRRGRFVTPGFGQAMEYQQAQIEAFDVIDAVTAGRTVDPSAYPMLQASVGIDIDPRTGTAASDVVGVAHGVKAVVVAGWLPFGAAIRRERLAGKAAVMAASTVEDAISAASAVNWPVAP